jgi:hypothetical protein
MRKLKILAIHSALNKDQNTRSAVDMWRIYRPMRELAKHVDWQIDHQPTFIKGIEKYKDAKEFTEEEMQKAFDTICQYDIVFSSYHADPTGYTMMKVAEEKAGVQFIMDVDDDMFAVNPDNPFWIKMDDEKCYWMQCMIRDNTWVSTTTEDLADVFRKRRPGHHKDTVFVNPNYITDEYNHKPVDNGEKIVIGYFGGSSHYKDLHETGVAEAVKRIMIENKNVRFKAIGMPLDKYVPRARYEFQEGKRGDDWLFGIYPTLNMDIALGPLDDNIFNNGKSNIKWQESTRAGAVFVASRLGPYKHLPPDVAVLVSQNTEDAWYAALKRVVESTELRKKMLSAAQANLQANWRLEDNWTRYKDMFEKVMEAKNV